MKYLLSAITFAIALALSPVSIAQDGAQDTPFEVNINTADAEELDKLLEGVGKVKAQAIVDYRKEHGAFESVEALEAVKGIGMGIVDKNRDRIVL